MKYAKAKAQHKEILIVILLLTVPLHMPLEEASLPFRLLDLFTKKQKKTRVTHYFTLHSVHFILHIVFYYRGGTEKLQIISISPVKARTQVHFELYNLQRPRQKCAFCTLLRYRIQNTRRLHICGWHAALCSHAWSRKLPPPPK